ncbi:hypothetical protein ACOMHN_002176 [Nucella lapillus]
MGSNSSKATQGQVLSNKPPSEMPQEPPYPGPPAQYNFINTNVIIGTHATFSFATTPMVTSNVDNYYPVLASQYAQGFRLLSFYQIPGQQKQQGMFSLKVALEYQGIFCRYPTAPRQESWQLRVEKSTIQLACAFTGIISPGVVSDTSHLLDSIARNTQAGGRLICIEMTGQQDPGSIGMGMRGLSPLMGVDLFFEVPSTPVPQQYIYSCVSVPITITLTMGLRPTPTVHCDWVGTLAAHLSQGWRLIEVFMDKSQQAKAFSNQATMNSMWFFEKPASRMQDPTPVFQGTVVDHQIKIKAQIMGANTTANWEPIIQDMGNKGWELACILETPEVTFSGMATVYMKCKMFFQRPLIPAGGVPPPAGPLGLSPPYDLAVEGMMGQGQVGAQGQGDAPSPPEPGFKSPSPPGDLGY